jgi:hypothetical protein
VAPQGWALLTVLPVLPLPVTQVPQQAEWAVPWRAVLVGPKQALAAMAEARRCPGMCTATSRPSSAIYC